jgi:GntR family transcriptional regulator
MEMERIVTRRQGRGTFVNDFASSETPLLFSAFVNFEGQSISGQKTAKSVERVAASAEEAARLGVRRGDELIKVERLRSHNGQTYMTETCLLPAKFFERLPEDTAGYRLSALAQSNAIMVGRADERVTVLSANESDARDLDVAVGTPLLGLDRVIFSDHDDPLEWRVARCHLRNERYVVRFN